MYYIYIYVDDYIMYIYIYVFTIVYLVDSFFLHNGTRYRHMTTNVYIYIYMYIYILYIYIYTCPHAYVFFHHVTSRWSPLSEHPTGYQRLQLTQDPLKIIGKMRNIHL